MMRRDRQSPARSPADKANKAEDPAVTQRTIIYIVGAIILILVIAYFLGFLDT